MEKSHPIITLLTDFGTADPYVGAMKGVMLSINPRCTIVDITHQIVPHDIREGCFTLAGACRFFPTGTIHVAVVDPGVGSERRPLLIETGEGYFIGPDNGIFTQILSLPGPKKVVQLTNSTYFLMPVSATFHGRDIFSPVAAHLSRGIPSEEFGTPLADYVLLDWPKPNITGEREVAGAVIHIDQFGNLITNLSRRFLEELHTGGTFHAEILGTHIKRLLPAYAYGEPEELFCVLGSSDFLEIAVKNGSARDLLRAQRGDVIKIWSSPQ